MPIDLKKITEHKMLYQIQIKDNIAICRTIGMGDESSKIMIYENIGDNDYKLYQYIYKCDNIGKMVILLSLESEDNAFYFCIDFEKEISIEEGTSEYQLLLIHGGKKYVTSNNFEDLIEHFIDTIQDNDFIL